MFVPGGSRPGRLCVDGSIYDAVPPEWQAARRRAAEQTHHPSEETHHPSLEAHHPSEHTQHSSVTGRRHSFPGLNFVPLTTTDAMDGDSNRSSSDSERTSSLARPPPQGGCQPPQLDRRSFPVPQGLSRSSQPVRQQQTPMQQLQMRGYSTLQPSSTMFDDDPGIMSEAETSSTGGFRRGAKVRSSLPVVRTPSKTMERPLGVVFLQYGNETKRALLPNEITSLYTVKALFVRSFPRQLNMEYLDSPACKIYILDSSRDMFYDMEDLRDIRDRSVLRIFETGGGATHQPPPPGHSNGGSAYEDNSYFSEPEFDGDYQSQHVHKAKGKSRGYDLLNSFPPGARPPVGTYPPRGTTDATSGRLHRPGAGPPPKPQRAGYARGARSVGPVPRTQTGVPPRGPGGPSVYIAGDGEFGGSPERGRGGPYPAGAGYDDPYYGRFPPALVDEEARNAGFFDTSAARRTEPVVRFNDKVRVESMERQLANLTGMVHKALNVPPRAQRAHSDLESGYRSDRELLYPSRSTRDKSVSFEKSVSFSDDPHGPNKQHSPTHAERIKPAPPPKPIQLVTPDGRHNIYRGNLHLSPETYNQLRCLQKKARDLRQEMRKLRRLSQEHSLAVREMMGDTFSKIRVYLLADNDMRLGTVDPEVLKIRKEEEAYREVIQGIEKDLGEVEHHVEDLRSSVINRQRRVNLNDVEGMALMLTKSSKTVTELQRRFPEMERSLRTLISLERDRVQREESFLGAEPQRLDNALQRIKKLSGTLVTLKRLASVQDQRVPDHEEAQTAAGKSTDSTGQPASTAAAAGDQPSAAAAPPSAAAGNPLDALLSELQTFSPERRPGVRPAPLGGRTSPPREEAAPRPAPPPPPPRTSSKSPLISPSSPLSPHYPAAQRAKLSLPADNAGGTGTGTGVRHPAPLVRTNSEPGAAALSSTLALSDENLRRDVASSNSSSSESVNSQEGLQRSTPERTGVLSRCRQEALERRETELRRKQQALQQQYARLQAMSSAPRANDVKKTGSEGDLPTKLGGLSLAPATTGGSLSDLSTPAAHQQNV
ncbi:coiled-coil domain-containing protein AGAP005037-like isoform X3 [Amphibalanus amphitrite]|uniref:coiled-coil domain-containing protein AGAP005037-like isoform X3 n=1 Tax=Amphibalanus amphitrite TaxID=1232801 RepID=UPI001C9270AB|nr:coiled-coil domain-containing protein AGAP005037-like isoform X3 [Amphibalanus amphitrite]